MRQGKSNINISVAAGGNFLRLGNININYFVFSKIILEREREMQPLCLFLCIMVNIRYIRES
jgi:hypothetical protein